MTSTAAPMPAHAADRHESASADHRTGWLAALRSDRFRALQLVLFALGSVLMPLGILAIALGWYGSAHAHYDYDQNVYLISGGIMGLGLTFLGGFLYFGAWLAKNSSDQRDTNRQLSEALTALSYAVQRLGGGAPVESDVVDGTLVVAGSGTTVHRRDCALIAHRDDLRELDGHEYGLAPCRVCRPAVD